MRKETGPGEHMRQYLLYRYGRRSAICSIREYHENTFLRLLRSFFIAKKIKVRTFERAIF